MEIVYARYVTHSIAFSMRLNQLITVQKIFVKPFLLVCFIFRFLMSEQVGKSNSSDGGGDKPKCKPCCACPETKQVRDAW